MRHVHHFTIYLLGIFFLNVTLIDKIKIKSKTTIKNG